MRSLREDYTINPRSRLKWTFLTPGFQALLAYRLGVWCNGLSPWILRVPLRQVPGFIELLRAQLLRDRALSHRADRTAASASSHQHGIVIDPRAVIGDDCMIRQGVTIGGGGRRDDAPRAPRLGDRVHLGAGAVLAGPISIGDDVVIGPNAVVMTSVPPAAR